MKPSDVKHPSADVKRPSSVACVGTTYRALFSTFFRIGLFTFGGGYAMIPLIQKEVVEKHGWLENEEIVDLLALAQTVPGAIAINAATLIGKRLRGNRGGIAATCGVILPSYLIITIIAGFFASFQQLPAVQAAFLGIRPAVAALMGVAVWKIGKTAVRDMTGWFFMLMSFTLVAFLGVHALLTILGAAVLGLAAQWLLPGWMGKVVRGDKQGEEE